MRMQTVERIYATRNVSSAVLFFNSRLVSSGILLIASQFVFRRGVVSCFRE